ncbi:transporter substrate-binding domain-containing protein, partial [Mesorhizobium sp. BR1-1-7]
MLWKIIAGGVAAIMFALTATQTMATETIKVGITPTGVPFTFVDPATQKPAGAMVDLAAAIAEAIGTETEFQVIAFPALIPSLTTRRI